MSGRSLFFVLAVAVVALGLYVLVMSPGEAPVVPVQAPVAMSPRTTPPPIPKIDQDEAPVPVLDDVARDAAAEVERIKKEQEEMEKPISDSSDPNMR